MHSLERPIDLAYHAGPWISDMRVRRARAPSGMFMFFDRFLWWSSVEAWVRGAMARGEPWGCEV